jgi:hypothetical protein
MFWCERQPEQVPLHKTKQGLMPPPPDQIRSRWFHASFLDNPSGTSHRERGGFSPTTSPMNPAEVPAVPYEHLFCLSSRGHFLSPAQNSGYDRFPLAANGWGIIHPIPDKTPPLQAKVKETSCLGLRYEA